MASKQSSLEPTLHEMTPATPSSGIVPNPPLLAPVASPVPVEEAPAPVKTPSLPSSTTVDQDAASPSTSQTTPQSQSQIIPLSAKEESHDLEVTHMSNDPYFGILIPETIFVESSSTDVIHAPVDSNTPNSEHSRKWTKDHPLQNIIGELSRPVSTRLQLHEQSLFCYYDAFLTSVEPKTYKQALTQSCWIEAMQEELHEFERLEVWELVPPLDKVMVITLKWIYKVKLDELTGLLKNKARLEAVWIFLTFAAHINMIVYQIDTEEGLKQAPHTWYDLLSSFMLSQVFSKGTVDPTMFISRKCKDILLSPRCIFLNQSKYALESLKKYGMESCDLVDTPLVEKSKLDEVTQGKAVDPTHYRGMVGTFMYLTSSRLDLVYGVSFADADHAGCQDTRRSTSRSMQLLGDRLVSWPTKRQKSVAISNTIEFLIDKMGMRSSTPETLKELADEAE
ncbi:hypothetical protein Tco_0117437 [Tanacetum coccineum]